MAGSSSARLDASVQRRSVIAVALAFVLITCFGVARGAIGAESVDRAPPPPAFDGPPHDRDLDLNDLVPGNGRIDAVWYVAAGRGRGQVAVSWHYVVSRDVRGWPFRRRYVLTLWHPEDVTPGSAHWTPHALIRASPFPIVGQSVRLADVTGDGHDDLLVTVECSDCNHATAAVSVYATFGNGVRRIYGSGVLTAGNSSAAAVHGRVITETAWGARRGVVWFDEPRGGVSVCCPAFRLQTFMRWAPRGWRVVAQRRVRPDRDGLVHRGYPNP